MNTIDYLDAEPFVQIIDSTTTANTTYVGVAQPGSSRASAVWKIQRIGVNASGHQEIAWADGSVEFHAVWNDRAALPYGGSVA